MAAENYGFPDECRLKTPADFHKVFDNPVRSTDKFFTLLAVQNDLDHARLGLAIAKKNIKKAVTRNLIKRTVRENFRLRQQAINNLDIVVLARREAADASPLVLRKSLERHWLKLADRFRVYEKMTAFK